MISFALVCLSVVAIGVVSFVHFARLDYTVDKMIDISEYDFGISSEIEDGIMLLYKMQSDFILQKKNIDRDQLQLVIASLTSKIDMVKERYQEDMAYLEFLNLFGERIEKIGQDLYHGATRELLSNSDQLLGSYIDFKRFQKNQNNQRHGELRALIDGNSRRMLTILTISFFVCILLCLVIPAKVALPFKKVMDAVKELQECNFDVSIYYAQNDEVGELAKEINKMIAGLKTFEELRADRIVVENRKFDALANMVNLCVLVAKANGEVIYLNNLSYALLQIQSEDVIGKTLAEGPLPSAIVDMYKTAIKRRAKIDDEEISFPFKDDGKEEVFTGPATVIPIRGKDSSQDYYLMVISPSNETSDDDGENDVHSDSDE
jgi:soluble P-type ATPase